MRSVSEASSGNLLVRRTGLEDIVALALLALDMGIARTRAAEHVDHGAIQDMLGGVGRFEFRLVMCIKYRFHIHIFAKDSENLQSAEQKHIICGVA